MRFVVTSLMPHAADAFFEAYSFGVEGPGHLFFRDVRGNDIACIREGMWESVRQLDPDPFTEATRAHR